MSEDGTPMSSLPPRRMEIDELRELEDSERFLAIINDDQMVDLEEPNLFVWNCVFITHERVAAAVYSEPDRRWYRVYNESHDDAVLTEAYDAIRATRDENSLFERQPLTVSEATFAANRPTGEETSGYAAGDAFDCPVCKESHTVQFQEDEMMKAYDFDTSELYVECPDSRRGKLTIEFQARGSS